MRNGHHLVNTFAFQEKWALMQQPPPFFPAAFNLQEDETFTASLEIIHLNLAINVKLRISLLKRTSFTSIDSHP